MTTKTGLCRCGAPGVRARGSRDNSAMAERHPGLFNPTFYCEQCVSAAASRVLSTGRTFQGKRRLINGFARIRPALDNGLGHQHDEL